MGIVVRWAVAGWKAPGLDAPIVVVPGGMDRELLRRLKAHLRLLVRNAWREAFRNVEVIDPTGCLGDLPVPSWDEATNTVDDSNRNKYARKKANSLAEFVRSADAQFGDIVAALEELDKRDDETNRRIAAIKKLLAQEEDARDSDIRRAGDAFIAVECPQDCVLLTSNTKHFGPICKAIGKLCEGY